jgi:two-component system, sensor histidine kinase YesM
MLIFKLKYWFQGDDSMSKFLKSFRLSVFTKEFIIFIILVLPLYLFSINMNIKAQNDVRREQAEAAKAKVNFYVDMFEKEFENVISLQSRFIGDDDLQQLLVKNDSIENYTGFRHLNNLRNKLLSIKFQSKYIIEGTIYVPGINRQISDNVIQIIDKDKYELLTQLAQKQHYLITMINNNVYINITSNFSLEDEDSYYPNYIISVRISQEEISRMLNDIAGYKEGGAVLIGGDFGINMADKKSMKLVPKLKEFIENDIDEGISKLKTIKIDSKKYTVVYKKSTLLNTTVVSYVPEEKFLETLVRYNDLLWVISILTVFLVIIFSLMVHRTISTPLNKLVNAFKVVEQGELDISLTYKSNDEFRDIYERFNEMCERLKKLIKQVYEEKLYAKNAELKQLQYQINPHFLYNSFFMIKRMAYIDDCEGIEKFTDHLGNYYQFVTRNASDEVELYKEVGHAEDYVEIQSFRFRRRIKIEIDKLPEELKGIRVIRLIIQPILENSYNHGLKNIEEGGIIKVGFLKEGVNLRITVEDNGKGMDNKEIAVLEERLNSTDSRIEATALINVHKRLRIKYGESSGIRLYKSDLGGLGVELNVQINFFGEN